MKKITVERKKMSEVRKSTIVLAVALVLTLAVGIIAVTGLYLDGRGLYKLKAWVPSLNTDNWPTSIPLGMGLGGGTYTEYQATLPEGSELSLDKALTDTTSILRTRLNEKGYLEGSISQTADSKIRVELPNAKEKAELLSLLSSSGKLIFSFPDGVFLEGNHIKTAVKETDSSTAQMMVRFVLDTQGTAALADATKTHTGQVLTVTMDGETLVNGTVEEPIFNGEISISGFVSEQAAWDTAIILRSGMLPAQIAQVGTGDVAPTMGDGILRLFVICGLILLVAAIVFLIARFLLGGVVAAWALWVHIILTFFLMAVFPGTQLTLLGLMGLVLGIALFVGINAFYLEKFAQGLRPGRLHKVSLQEGWRAAQSKVWKVHGICLAVSLVLLILPIGFLRSLAVTTLASTFSSLLVTVVVTRFLLYNVARLVKKEPGRFARVKNV